MSGNIKNERREGGLVHTTSYYVTSDKDGHEGYGDTAEDAQKALEEAQYRDVTYISRRGLSSFPFDEGGPVVREKPEPHEPADESSEDEEERLQRLAEEAVEASWQAGEFDIGEDSESEGEAYYGKPANEEPEKEFENGRIANVEEKARRIREGW